MKQKNKKTNEALCVELEKLHTFIHLPENKDKVLKSLYGLPLYVLCGSIQQLQNFLHKYYETKE